jgi:hypothetical protein
MATSLGSTVKESTRAIINACYVRVGEVYGRLTVLRRAESAHRERLWLCRCACGGTALVKTAHLRSGNTVSCGCRRAEVRAAIAAVQLTHGMSSTSEYRVWKGMKERCHSPASVCWPNYGGRGIKVCEAWESFENFYADMGPMSAPKLTIERDDNNGDYKPGNCRWATQSEQMSNTRRSTRIEYGGRVQTVDAWARELGIPHQTIRGRLRRGYTHAQALGKERKTR